MNQQHLQSEVISADAAEFLICLHEKFENLRQNLLIRRRHQAAQFAQGSKPHFLAETKSIRSAEWSVAPAPWDLEDRRVEITGPAEPKMMINALNSGAKVFMADLEDSLSPTWENILQAQESLRRAVQRTLSYQNQSGKLYSLGNEIATLMVRPRGLHLVEGNFQIRGTSISASLFDFGLYFFHNVHELLRQKSGPYFYLPKIENHEEAAWWNDVFNFAQDKLNIKRGTIRTTVLIETITAAFEMDEILFALQEHASGLNAGRWDYIFSIIKKFNFRKDLIFPDRAQITMNSPLMEAYCHLLVKTCHRRGAHAIGGMAAFIPNRKLPGENERAFQQVSQDKAREARIGFDGTWVAHPDLIAIAQAEFDQVLGKMPQQKKVLPSMLVTESDLLTISSSQGCIAEEGVRTNINVSLLYLDSWLSGVGAAALHNLMEDVATAEISRSQLWQWLHHSVHLSDGRRFTPELYHEILSEEVEKLQPQVLLHLEKSVHLLNGLVLDNEFQEFLTTSAYEMLIHTQTKGDIHDLKSRDSITTARL